MPTNRHATENAGSRLFWRLFGLVVLWLGLVVGTIVIGRMTTPHMLALTAQVERKPQLFVVDVPKRITMQVSDFDGDTAYKLSGLDWSPDGRQLALEYWRAANAEIMTFDMHTRRGLLRYQSNEGDRAPRWSPDGTRLLFTQLRQDNQATLRLINLQTDETTRLHDVPYYFNFRAYAWSPDSRYVAYYFRRMFVLDTLTGEAREVARGYDFEDLEQIVWTPDSRSVVFTATAPGASGRNPPRHIYRVDVTNGDVQAILANPVHEFRPKWLARRNEIIYQSFDPYGQLRHMNVTTGRTRRLMELPSSPVLLSRDGRYAAYLRVANPSQIGSHEQLWVINLSGGEAFLVTPPHMAPTNITWR